MDGAYFYARGGEGLTGAARDAAEPGVAGRDTEITSDVTTFFRASEDDRTINFPNDFKSL